jgi:hypothetical protein
MSVRADIVQALEGLNDDEIQQVSEYVAFLRFRSRFEAHRTLDPAMFAGLYAEFADEDRELADEGLAEYNEHLITEDSL